jgi:hypothetical protein
VEARTGLESVPDGAFLRETCWHSAGLAFLPQAEAKPHGRGEGRRRSPRPAREWRLRARKQACRSTTWTAEYKCYTEEACGGGYGHRSGAHPHEIWIEMLTARENEIARSVRQPLSDSRETSVRKTHPISKW